MANLITAGVLFAVIGAAGIYLVRAKRRGERCVGCPHSGHCGRGARKAAAGGTSRNGRTERDQEDGRRFAKRCLIPARYFPGDMPVSRLNTVIK